MQKKTQTHSSRYLHLRRHPLARVGLTIARILTFVAIFSAVLYACAQADVPGSADHLLLKRFQGSTIRRYKAEDFGQFKAALGPGYQSGGASVALRKSQVFEGKHTMIQYTAPSGKSDLEIIRSYERALTSAGFTKLYACGGEECGVGLFQQIYSNEESLNPMLGSWDSTIHYTVWKGDSNGTGYTVAVGAVAPHAGTGAATYQMDIVENTAMAEGTVTIDAAQLKRSLGSEGHVALYGILFDSNSAVIRPESATTLAEIAKLLKTNSTLRAAIVGHTDTQGAWDANIDLSRRRAAAVVQELNTKYAISATRVISVGVGAASPIADNRSEAGRAKNRRVELVELP